MAATDNDPVPHITGDEYPLGTLLTPEDLQLDSEYMQTIVEYYSQAGMDYEPWSQKYNMHFGYYRWGVNFLVREQLLDEMNRQVLLRLQLHNDGISQLIDLGCGVGATTRYCAEHYPATRITGATIVPWQIDKAMAMTDDDLLDSRVCFKLIDYRRTPFQDNVFDGAWAMESSCYDAGLDKKAFLQEAFRVLKPGGRLVVTDGFRKQAQGSPFFEMAFDQVCKGWSLETFANIDAFTDAMAEIGFENIEVSDISWHLAPSVMYVPWVSLRFLLQQLLHRSQREPFKKRHFIAPMMGLVIGLHRGQYGYYLISATKPSVRFV